MDSKLFWLIYLSTYLCLSNCNNVQNVTIESTTNGLNSSMSSPLSSTIKTNSSIAYELLSTKSTENKETIGQLVGNKTSDGQLEGKDILNGQEQRQNQFTQGRGPPNRFPPQYQGNYNYGPQGDNYNRQQGLPNPRQSNYGNQANQQGSQLNSPYDFLDGIIPNSDQNGFLTRTPQNQQKQQSGPNQPANRYPIANNNYGLNPNQQSQGNVGDKTVNQGFGLSDNPSDGYNDQSDEAESPELGQQGEDANQGTENDSGEENVSDNGEGDGGNNEQVTPNEEGESGEEPSDESVANDEGEGEGEGEGVTGSEGEVGGDGGVDSARDEGAGDGGEKTQFDDSDSTNGGEGDAEESANSDEATDADGSAGQGGEQDPSNDPDLAQFQNFQGGNFPGDLFPPGILSQQDLNDIQKSIEEQQKKEAEKQKSEEEAAAGDQSEGGEGDGTGEENTGEGEGENGGEGETDQPAAAPPVNPYTPDAGYGQPINNQANLLAINRAIVERNRNPGLMENPNENRYGGNNGGGFSNRGDFGTGIQDYEYERPKVNQDEDETPNRLRDNPLFNRNRFIPSHRRGSNEGEDEEDDRDERSTPPPPPPYLRNRFSNRFERFRPRLFNRPGRYNNDLGDYGVHRANSNQQQTIDFQSNQYHPYNNNFNPSSDNKNYFKQSINQEDNQSVINYDNND
ncbi:LOW QUALITY PROTEIN: uncharacterized protein DDB_G0290685-like [Panonychus citri]|uniref:LOW QUALITY PROTEIN: uncharacterized protein DDB_G0290685-like n=1 Tax=Panonychus citri TaxID=50023 RepID=UPI002306EE84|nr:LOW QUALITY PROTEIN: uncharacterized protein DDB_G0290685-like [Panonychus citri]